jgi:DegV family protein with EDD domain
VLSKVVVVTDSSATIPEHLVRDLGIVVVPIRLNLDGKSYRDGIDITPSEFYRRLRATGSAPTTSAPSVGEFAAVFEDAAQGALGVVAIHVARSLSSIHDTAVTAARSIKGTDVRVVDAEAATMAHGFVVLEAARAAAAGAGIDIVEQTALEMRPRVRFYVLLDTLEYLHRGGRVGSVARLMGTALQIKPVINLVDGHIEPYARPRTRKKATARVLQAMRDEVGTLPVHVAVLHADVPDEAQELHDRVSRGFDCRELLMAEFTPVMGAHTGPGVLGVAFYAERL